MEKITFQISDLDANQRIDKYLKKQLSRAPANFIYRLFRLKDIKVNGKKVNPEYIINANDEITIYLTAEQKSDFIQEYHFVNVELTSPVIYEDENILVVNKLTGILVHADINEQDNTLTNQVLSYLATKDQFDPTNRGYIPSPINRIDKNTSGVMVFAKKQEIHQELSKALHDNQVKRRYIALVHGAIHGSGTIEKKLQKEHERGLVEINEEGRNAITHYKVLHNFQNHTLVDVLLETGRSNQIRVHFSSINHPLVGDQKYGKIDGFKYLCLHHYSLTFYNMKGTAAYLNQRELEAPLSEEFKSTLTRIEEKL